jgi:hypothetical protein
MYPRNASSANDMSRFPIGCGDVGFDEGTAELTEVVDHQVHGDVVRILIGRWYPMMTE